jgi:uncharacterized damage-inducible protein DinB
VIPLRILEGFKNLPREIVDLCRPHSWVDLTTPPRDGMRPIREVLVHMIGAEAYWIQYVVLGGERPRLEPASFGGPDAILRPWESQRAATLAFVQGLTPEQLHSLRPFPWNAAESATVEEIVWHVVTHEQYHRGQIFTRLALLGRRDLPDYDLLR